MHWVQVGWGFVAGMAFGMFYTLWRINRWNTKQPRIALTRRDKETR